MALDKLVDSTQLDADLTSVANAIRTKGGTSAQLAFPADFVTAIGSIPTGGGGDTLEIKGAAVVNLCYETGLPVKYKLISGLWQSIYFSNGNSTESQTVGPIEEIEIAVQSSPQTSGAQAVGNWRNNADYALKKINFNFLPLGNIYNFGFVYDRAPHFEDLLGLNFIYVGGGNYRIGSMANLKALKNVTCKPNTLGQLGMTNNSWSLPQSSLLTDDSLCQIANALCATNTSTLSFHATPKARCSALMGTVSQVTDDTGTYDFFTADANGAVSLADFITTTKGWTLA